MPSINCKQCGKVHPGVCFSCPACNRHHNPSFCPPVRSVASAVAAPVAAPAAAPAAATGFAFAAFDNLVGTIITADGPVQISGAPSAVAATAAALLGSKLKEGNEEKEGKEEKGEKEREKRKKKNRARHEAQKRARVRRHEERKAAEDGGEERVEKEDGQEAAEGSLPERPKGVDGDGVKE